MALPWSHALPAQSTKFKGLMWLARLHVSCPGLPFRLLLPGSPSHTTPCSCGNEHLPSPVPSQVKCHLLPASVCGTQTMEVCPILGFVSWPFAATKAPAPGGHPSESEAPGTAQVGMCPWALVSTTPLQSGLVGKPCVVPAPAAPSALQSQTGQQTRQKQQAEDSGRSVLQGCGCPAEERICFALETGDFLKNIYFY